MAITEAPLTTGGNNTSQTTVNTASITPTANRLVLLSVAATLTTGSGADPGPSSVTGCGLTWEVAASKNWWVDGSNFFADLTIYRAMGASPSAGAVTINWPTNYDNKSWSIAEFDGIDTSGANGSGAIVQSANNNGTTQTALSATLAAFGSADNATYGAFVSGSSTLRTFTPGTGFTEIHDDAAAKFCSVKTEWRADNDTSVDGTLSAAGSAWGAIAIEIKAAASGGVIETTGSSSGVATVAADAAAIWDSVGSSTGVGTATGVGVNLFTSTGSSSGVATVDGISGKIAGVVGDSQGVGTVTGLSVAIWGSVGNSLGTAAVTGISANVFDSVGNSSGVGVVTGLANAIWDSVGSSLGISDVLGLANAIWDSIGNSVGVGTALGEAADIGSGSIGDSQGLGTATGVGAATVTAVGSASGSASVTGFGQDISNIVIPRKPRITFVPYEIGGYDFVSVSDTQTDVQIGAFNDFLARIDINVFDTGAATFTLKDGVNTVFMSSGANSIGQYSIELGIVSLTSQGFLVTTGAGVSVLAIGDFT